MFVKASLIMLVTFIEFENTIGIDIVLIVLQKIVKNTGGRFEHMRVIK